MGRRWATGRSPLQECMFTVMPGVAIRVSSCRPRKGGSLSAHSTGHNHDDQSRAEVIGLCYWGYAVWANPTHRMGRGRLEKKCRSG